MKELLPIGTVIKHKKIEFPLVIIGYGGKSHSNVNFDYVGYPFPNGFIKKELVFGINTELIDEIIFKGYEDDQFEELSELLLKGGASDGETR